MTNPSDIDVDADISTHAVSIVDDNVEDFPVLKAFQQYIDAEQNKARKRMLSLCIFFGCLITVVIVVFLILLNSVSMRNQAQNDRLIEYLMKERDRQSAVVVQQPAPANDHSTMFLTSKIEEMQKQLAEAQHKAEAIQKKAEAMENARKEEAAKAATEAAIEAAKEKARIKEEIEVARLKAQLAAEREKAAAEREKKRQEELEAYRRKHYPELYEKPVAKTKTVVSPATTDDEAKADKEIDTLLKDLNDKDAISYFDTEDDDAKPAKKSDVPPSAKESTSKQPPDSYSIPVEVKGNRTQWLIPNS